MKTKIVLLTTFFLAAFATAVAAQDAGDVRTEPYEIICNYDIAVSGYVDMGLSVKWAACNIGASSPEHSGYYFAWGEVEPTPVELLWVGNEEEWQPWLNYKHFLPGGPNTKGQLIKYNSDSAFGVVDNKVVLDKEDDAAFVATNGVGRTPTAEEFMELVENCTWEFIDYKGAWGAVVTGPNGAQIFLDAMGEMKVTGEDCSYYMTSSLDSRPLYAVCCLIGNDSFRWDARTKLLCYMSECFNVRAVCD